MWEKEKMAGSGHQGGGAWGGMGNREDDMPQLHFYLETLGKVYLARPAFLHYTGERLVLLMSPPPFPGDEVTGFS